MKINTDTRVLLSTDLDNPDSIPYFLWDEPMTVAEFKSRLISASISLPAKGKIFHGSDKAEYCPEQRPSQNREITDGHPSSAVLTRLHRVYWSTAIDRLINCP